MNKRKHTKKHYPRIPPELIPKLIEIADMMLELDVDLCYNKNYMQCLGAVYRDNLAEHLVVGSSNYKGNKFEATIGQIIKIKGTRSTKGKFAYELTAKRKSRKMGYDYIDYYFNIKNIKYLFMIALQECCMYTALYYHRNHLAVDTRVIQRQAVLQKYDIIKNFCEKIKSHRIFKKYIEIPERCKFFKYPPHFGIWVFDVDVKASLNMMVQQMSTVLVNVDKYKIKNISVSFDPLLWRYNLYNDIQFNIVSTKYIDNIIRHIFLFSAVVNNAG